MTKLAGNGSGGTKPKPKVYLPIGASVVPAKPKRAPSLHGVTGSSSPTSPSSPLIPKASDHAPGYYVDKRPKKGILNTPVAPVKAPVRVAAKPKPTTTVGGRFAAVAATPVVSAAEIASRVPLGTVALNTLKDVRDLVPTTIEGIDAIASAGAHDLLGVATGATHVGPAATPVKAAPQHSELKALAENAWKSSITDKVIHGHFGAALVELVHHPLYGALEFAGTVGAVGRVLGAAGRAGVLGEHVADAAKLTRDDRPLIPGTPGLKRHGSPNLLVRVAQHGADKVTLPKPIERAVVDHYVRRDVNHLHGITTTIADGHNQEIIAEHHEAARGERTGKRKIADHTPVVKNFVKQHIPHDRKVAYDAASAQIFGAASRHSVIADITHLRDSIAHHIEHTPMNKTALKAAKANHADLSTFLDLKPVQAVNEISASFLKRGATQTAEQLDLGLLSKAQAETAPLHGAVAMGHVPGNDVRMTAKADRLPSERKALYMHAVKDAKVATKQLHDAEIKAAKMKPEARKAYLGVFKEHLDEAKTERASLEQYKNDHVSGIVETTDTRLPGRKPLYAVRRVPSDEVRRRLVAVDRNPDEMGYVNMTPPVSKEGRVASLAKRYLTRGDGAHASRTAQGIEKGNYRPGGAMLLDSQLQTQRAIDRARGFDLIDGQQSIRHEDGAKEGELINEDKYGIVDAKAKWEKDHPDIPVTIIPRHSANSINRLDDYTTSGGNLDPHAEDEATGTPRYTKDERFGLQPTVVSNHYLKHLEADKVGNGNWGTLNRAFRNTVLPLSPKWIAGNDIEGLLRSGLIGAGPNDARIVGKVLDTYEARAKAAESVGDHATARMNRDAADRIKAIMNGQHYSMANRRNHEALVAHSMEHPDKTTLLRNRPVIKQVADGYMHGIVEPIFEFNRKVESGFDRAVLGAHMHHQMVEFGANMYQAAKAEQHWIDKLADGYSDPALVLDASRFMQKTLGQYSRFGPTAKKWINTIAPFAPWYANALRFVYLTMPADHPIVQSILLAAGRTVQDEYASQFKSQGELNDKFGGHRFGSLGTSLAVPGAGLVDISRYLPWGAPANGPLNAVTSPIGPQLSGPAQAIWSGEDPFGSQLKDKNGPITDKGQQTLVGLSEFFLSLAGPLDLASRIVLNHGDTAYSGDTLFTPLKDRLKPDSHHGGPGYIGGVERSMIPGYPTYLHALSSSSGGSTPLPGGSTPLPGGSTPLPSEGVPLP